MRGLLFILSLFLIFSVIRTVVRSAVKAYHEKEPQSRIMGDEMVQDPECRTYVVKDRAVTRHIGGRPLYFCSDACAGRYEDKHRT
jgi:uncharacterized protein